MVVTKFKVFVIKVLAAVKILSKGMPRSVSELRHASDMRLVIDRLVL